MTRETKVGLLIGLGVILLVGIILTDYLSVAQNRKVPTMTDFAVDTQRSLVPPGRRLPGTEPYGPSRSTRAIEIPKAATVAPPSPHVANPFRPQPKAVRRMIETPAAAQIKRLVQLGVSPLPLRNDQPPRSDVAGASVPVPKRPRHHLVDSRETLWHIAQKYYGDGTRWREIKNTNPTKVTRDGGVQAGVRLVIPGVAPDAIAVEAVAPPVLPPQNVVTVRPRDTLSAIAGRVLGDPKRWRMLYEVNRDRIKNPDRLQVGLQLRVPFRG